MATLKSQQHKCVGVMSAIGCRCANVAASAASSEVVEELIGQRRPFLI